MSDWVLSAEPVSYGNGYVSMQEVVKDGAGNEVCRLPHFAAEFYEGASINGVPTTFEMVEEWFWMRPVYRRGEPFPHSPNGLRIAPPTTSETE